MSEWATGLGSTYSTRRSIGGSSVGAVATHRYPGLSAFRGGAMDEPTLWRRSTSCGDSACVEVAMTSDSFLVRNSTDPHGRTLTISRARFAAFIAVIKSGRTI